MAGPGLRWGIVGHGGIAPTFLAAARHCRHEVVMVVGRDRGRAGAFAERHGVPVVAERPEDLAGTVDAAYVATPHTAHHDATMALLEAGVPVLCEKPLAVNRTQAVAMVDAAQRSGTFLMEAMWTRHLPVHQGVRRWIREGRIGAPKLVEASFGFAAPHDPSGRLWSPDLAGGSLLDVGVYPLTLADLVYGAPPTEVHAVAERSPEGVDAHVALALRYPCGGLARLGSAINAPLGWTGRIVGEHGVIEVPEFWRAQAATLSVRGEVEEMVHPHAVNGFEYQVADVERCLADSRIESDVVPHAWSVAMAELLDRIRADIGVTYPADRGV